MRKQLLAGVALAFGSVIAAGSAYAADLSPTPEVVPVPGSAAIVNWQGFHIGLQGGYGWAKADGEFASGNSGARDFEPAGWLGGGQVGFDWQSASGLVLGVEADYSWAGLTDSFFGPGAFGGTIGLEQTVDTFGTVRVRLGQAMGRWLPYVTGGYAFGTSTRTESGSFSGSDTNSHSGWTAGAGAEYAINDHLSIRGQFLYADLGTQNYDVPGPPGGTDVSLKAGFATIGLNLRF